MRRIFIIAGPLLLLTAAAQRPPAAPTRPAPARPAPAAGPAIPTRVTAKVLSDLCAQDRGVCLGYIVGSTDSWASAMAAAGRPQLICIPPAVNNDQVTQATVRYIRAHPEEGGLNAAIVIYAALKSAFPCGY